MQNLAYLKLESRALRLAVWCGRAGAYRGQKRWLRVYHYLRHREQRPA